MTTKQEVMSESDNEIEPTDLIDIEENKPKITEKIEQQPIPQKTEMKIENKKVEKLTEAEKDYLVNLYKNGGEHELYSVKFFKNGNYHINKKKQKPSYDTTNRLLSMNQNENKPLMMTTEQLLMEHVMDLETKYNLLYQKHKKLKRSYKSIQEDIYCDDEENHAAEQNNRNQTEQIQQHSNEQEQQTEFAENPRQQEEFQNNYINKLRRPQRGYRALIARNQ